jgi:hypothetical protein
VKVALVDVDGHNFPNFALMRISAWHKAQGDSVEWYSPLFSNPDRIYASKVFTFTPDYMDFDPAHPEPIKGGTGYRMYNELPAEIDRMLPDYSIYPMFDFAIGFLSRGCIRNCPWCVVPRKEGALRQYDDIERIAQGRKRVILMDNNFLANDFEFVKDQLKKSVRLGLSIDFNQGLDARLITPENAALLAKCKWFTITGNNKYIRFSCDTAGMIEPLRKAVKMLRQVGYNGEVFVYVLAQELQESLERVRNVLEIDKKVHPFVQPFRNLDGDGEIVDPELKRLARWCNMAAIRKTCNFEDYKG